MVSLLQPKKNVKRCKTLTNPLIKIFISLQMTNSLGCDETEYYRYMLTTHKGLEKELNEEIQNAAIRLIHGKNLNDNFYMFYDIEDILYSIIDFEKRFLKHCKKQIKQIKPQKKMSLYFNVYDYIYDN